MLINFYKASEELHKRRKFQCLHLFPPFNYVNDSIISIFVLDDFLDFDFYDASFLHDACFVLPLQDFHQFFVCILDTLIHL